MSRWRRVFTVLVGAAGLTACGEVEQCREGRPGCLGGPPVDGACAADLVVSNGTCSEPGASPAPLACGCGEAEVCTLDTYECVDYCAPLDVQIGSITPPTPLSCEATVSFEQLCENRCILRCRQWQNLCESQAGCSEEGCKSEAERSACQAECGSADSPALCMAQACGDTRAQGCRNVTCPTGAPNCDGVACRNACPGYNFDGVCDDGDLGSASSGVCAFASDCADCGPRFGEAPAQQPLGGPCAFHSGCLGNNPVNIAQASAWCIDIDPTRGISRCAPDCSDDERVCPAGSSCFKLSGVDRDGDGKPEPLEQEGRIASACFPVACQ